MQSEINFFIQIRDFDFIGKPVEYRSYEIKAGLVEILNITSDNRAKTWTVFGVLDKHLLLSKRKNPFAFVSSSRN